MVHTPFGLESQQWNRARRSWAWSLLLSTACSASHSAPATVPGGAAAGSRGSTCRGRRGAPLLPRGGRGRRYRCGAPRRPGAQPGGASAGPRPARSAPHGHLLRPARERPLGDAGHAAAHGRSDGEGSGGDSPGLPPGPVTLLGALLGRRSRRALRGRISRARCADDSRRPGSAAARSLPRAVRHWQRTARRDSAETAQQAVSDSIQRVAEDPYPACRVSIRIFLRGVAATPEAASRIKGDLCAATPTNLRLEGVLRQQGVGLDLGHGGSRGLRLAATRRAWVSPDSRGLHGDRDPLPLAGSEEWTRVLAHARLVVISDAGHYPHAEQPGQFFPAVEAFLAGAD